jgi:ribonuclease BN (tRNA processing enzyme)
MSSVTFLGTGGARVIVFKQLLASGGLWLDIDGTLLLVDPGPGSIVQCTKRKLHPTKLSAVIITHRHLDHCADVNSIIEGMTTGGLERRGILFAPRDAIEDDPVVLRYLRAYLDEVRLLTEGGEYQVGNARFSTPVRHRHPAETYGLMFETPQGRLGLIADTAYFPELADNYRCDYLIINTVLLEPRPGVDHLCIAEAQAIIEAVSPKVAVLTHFGMNVWRSKPWEIAARMTEEIGVKVIAARDGMHLELE